MLVKACRDCDSAIDMSVESFYGKKGGKRKSEGARRRLPFPSSPSPSTSASASDQPPVTCDYWRITRGTKMTPRKINFMLSVLEEQEKVRGEEEREVQDISPDDSDRDPDYVPDGEDKGREGREFFWGKDLSPNRGGAAKGGGENSFQNLL